MACMVRFMSPVRAITELAFFMIVFEVSFVNQSGR